MPVRFICQKPCPDIWASIMTWPRTSLRALNTLPVSAFRDYGHVLFGKALPQSGEKQLGDPRRFALLGQGVCRKTLCLARVFSAAGRELAAMCAGQMNSVTRVNFSRSALSLTFKY